MDKPFRFLIVDDDIVDSAAVWAVLGGKNGAQIDIVRSLYDAKRKIRTGHYDLMVLDLGLPDSQGLDGVIDLQATAPEIPMVVVTGNRDLEVGLRAIGIGAEDFIKKEPLDLSGLRKVAQFAMERHQHKRQLYKDMDGMRLSLDEAMLQSQTDALTGLPNRRGLERHLERLSRYQQEHPLIVGLADMDGFKAINDSFGHDIGDLILLEFVARLLQCMGEEDFAARVGGDEFIIVMGGADRKAAERTGRKLLLELAARPAMADGRPIPFSASLALAELNESLADVEQILKQNHEMMAAAKGSGKARVCCSWNPQGAIVGGDKDDAPGEALESGADFIQYARPIQGLPDGKVLGGYLAYTMEGEGASLRKPAFSRARTSGSLGHLMLQFLRQAARWREEQPLGSRLHVDMEAEALKPWMVGEITSVFPALEARAKTCLFFATDFLTRVGADVLVPIHLLKKAGFEIGVRGLGAGATVLEHVMMMEPNWVRVDASFTSHVSRLPEQARRMEQLLEFMKALKADLVVEDISSPQDQEVLASLGCKVFYGLRQRRVLSAVAA
jgi:diguanylate cyclase (GGDEF)-like protein